MKRTASLLVLVKSMSKAEKRFFKLYSNLQSGDKVYNSLYSLTELCDSPEETEKKFSEEHPGRNFEVAVKHLYSVILDSLLVHREHQDIQDRIFKYISKSGILFERGLTDEAMAELRKGRKLAELYENDALQLLTRRTELKYMSGADFEGIREKRLVDKHMRLNEVLKYARSANLHIQLFDILKYRTIYKGSVRSERDKQHLNDLVLSELHLMANSSYRGFETEKLHLLFQATYFLNSGNYKTALRFYQDLINLFEENRHRLWNPPIHYFNALTGILGSLQSAGLYNEMPYFIEKLKKIGKGPYPVEFILSVTSQTFLYEFSYMFDTGDIESAKNLLREYEDSLFKKSTLLGLQTQLQIYMCLVILFISDGQPAEARRHMKKIIGAGKSMYGFPEYRASRLLNLLLQGELHNYEFFDNEIASIKRTIKFEKNNYQYRTEKILFKFLKKYPLPYDRKERLSLFEKLSPEMESIKHDKYERPLLKMFDFMAWIEGKLTGRKFPEILAERHNSVTPHSSGIS